MEENVKKEVKETPKKKSKKIIILVIVLVMLFALIIFGCIFAMPIIKEQGIEGLFNPIKLTKEEKKYYDLYVDELTKYESLKEENYRYTFRTYYFNGIEEPVIVLYHENYPYKNTAQDKVTLFYLKNDKVITKEYDAIANVELIYNTEKDEYDYYLVQLNDEQQYTYTLLKDIITENSNPYSVTLSRHENYETTYKSDGKKVIVQKYSVAFIIISNADIKSKVNEQMFSFVDGVDKFKGAFKKALTNRYELEDLVNDTTKEQALKQISQYNIEPGDQILGNKSNTSTNTNQNKNNNNNNNNNNNIQSQKPISKCNEGFVYVSDDNRCYSNTDVKNQINSCQPGEVNLNGDCGTAVDSSLCASNSDQYIEMEGKCIDKNTLHAKSMECPSGYDILFGSYSGKEFNGDCYRNVSPNK